MVSAVTELPQSRFVNKIPVRNLWLLMFYASDLKESGLNIGDIEDAPDDIPDLVAEILVRQVERRLRRNLSTEYQRREQILPRVRGRIDILKTTRHQLLLRGQVANRFDELTIDSPRNRYVCAALEKLSRIVSNTHLRQQCSSLAGRMIRMGVSSNRPTHAEMSMLRLSRHDAEDRLMLSYARLVFELEIPTEEAGSRALPIAERDDTDSYLQWIYSLYERAVYGFYDYVLTPQGWTVSHGDILKWPEPKLSKGMKAVLPRMKTDIVLEHKIDQRRIVIDTKFNPLLKEGQYDKMTLKSTYLYQIYAYLRSQEDNDNELVRYSEGLMLHPSTDEMFDEALELQGHLIRFATVDLSAPAPTIREQLLRVVATPEYAVEYSEN